MGQHPLRSRPLLFRQSSRLALAKNFCLPLRYCLLLGSLLLHPRRHAPPSLVPRSANGHASYGYVFNMGYMNSYLSIGLGCFALAFLWPAKRPRHYRRRASPSRHLPRTSTGVLLVLGVGAYRLVWPLLKGWTRLILPAISGRFDTVHWITVHHPELEGDFNDPPSTNGTAPINSPFTDGACLPFFGHHSRRSPRCSLRTLAFSQDFRRAIVRHRALRQLERPLALRRVLPHFSRRHDALS